MQRAGDQLDQLSHGREFNPYNHLQNSHVFQYHHTLIIAT